MPKEYFDQYISEFPEEEIDTKTLNSYAKSIGRFIVVFSGLENELDHSLVNMIDNRSDHLGYTIISKMLMMPKIELFHQIYGQTISMINKDLTRKNDLDKLTKDLKDITIFRNNIVHANWYSLDKKGFVRIKVKADDEGVGILKEKITPETIEKNLNKASFLTNKLEDYYENTWSIL